MLTFAFIGGIILGLTGDVEAIDNNEIVFTIISVVLGAGCYFGLYHLLKRNWSKKKEIISEELIDVEI